MKIKTGYQNYEELMLDFDIFGQLVSEPQIPLNEYKELLYVDYRKTHLITLEAKRKTLGSLANTVVDVDYSSISDMGSDVDEIDLLSEDDIDFSEGSYLDAESYLTVPSNEEISQFLAERQAHEMNITQSDSEASSVIEEDTFIDLPVLSQETAQQTEEMFGTIEQGSAIVYEIEEGSDDIEEDDIDTVEDDGWGDDLEVVESDESYVDSEDDYTESEDDYEDDWFGEDEEEDIHDFDSTIYNDLEQESVVVDFSNEVVKESELQPVVSAFVDTDLNREQIPEGVPAPPIHLSGTQSTIEKPKKRKKKPKQKTKVSSAIEPIQKSVQRQENIKVQEPTDLREFLRKYPHSDLNFVLQHFSRKEVQKALALGKVIKKGNKLHI